MSKNQAENVIIEFLILSHLSKKVLLSLSGNMSFVRFFFLKKFQDPESSKTSLFTLGQPKSCSLNYREFIGAFYSEFQWFVKIWL
jgi:hypothetical protein